MNASKSNEVQARFAGTRILVVDDDESIRRLLLLHLNNAGCSVEAAATGEDALSLLKTTTYSAVLCDIALPRVDGFTVISQLREHEDRLGLPRCPAAAISAHETDPNPSLVADFDVWLHKPIGFRALDEWLAKSIDQRPGLVHTFVGLPVVAGARDMPGVAVHVAKSLEALIALASLPTTKAVLTAADTLAGTQEAVHRLRAVAGPGLLIVASTNDPHLRAEVLGVGVDTCISHPPSESAMSVIHRALRLSGQIETTEPSADFARKLRECRESFVQNTYAGLIDALEAVGRRDFDSVRRMGHKLKGGAATFGFQSLSHLGRELENSDVSEDAGKSARLIELAMSELRHASQRISTNEGGQ